MDGITPNLRSTFLKERRENAIEANTYRKIMEKISADVVTGKLPKNRKANVLQKNTKTQSKYVPTGVKRGRPRKKPETDSLSPSNNDMESKIGQDTMEEVLNANVHSTASNEIAIDLNVKELMPLVDKDDTAEEITCVPPPAVETETQSTSKKRTQPPWNVDPRQLNYNKNLGPSKSSQSWSQHQKKKKRYRRKNGGMTYADDFDDCDCLRSNCVGCHFPCRACGDSRCGHECRVNRCWLYESIETSEEEFKNPHLAKIC